MIKNENAIATEVSDAVDGVGAPIMRAAYSLRSQPSWITLSVAEGQGNAVVDVTAPTWKGRNGRSGAITVAAGELSEDVSLSQEGSNIWDITTPSLSFIKDGETKQFQGNSNAQAITFSADVDCSEWITLSKVTVAGAEYNSGEAIADDPGAEQLYAFSIDVTATANPTVDVRTGHITVNAIKYVVTQAAGDATLSVTPTSLTFAAAGETKQITITTNAAWTIE